MSDAEFPCIRLHRHASQASASNCDREYEARQIGESDRCPAHGTPACPMCSRNPSTCAAGDAGCGYYAATGMHWDTCPNRDRTPIASEPVNLRKKCLETALKYVMQDRNAAHGNPESNFSNIARYWNAHLDARFPDRDATLVLDATDVAIMMAAMKLARLSHNPEHEDSWIDLAGYAACGMDVALSVPPERPHDV